MHLKTLIQINLTLILFFESLYTQYHRLTNWLNLDSLSKEIWLLVVLKRWYIQVKRRKVWGTGQQNAPSKSCRSKVPCTFFRVSVFFGTHTAHWNVSRDSFFIHFVGVGFVEMNAI
jgi:hypothetical protein